MQNAAMSATLTAAGKGPAYTLRAAQPQDAQAIVGLITELAEFEQLAHLVKITAPGLCKHLFGPRPVIECTVAEGGAAVQAFALYFTNFSTFLGQPGLYLEDLYVKPAWRGQGVGGALLRHLAALAVERGCGRFEWSVLDWNANAIAVYERMGATVMPEWRICRLSGEALGRYKR